MKALQLTEIKSEGFKVGFTRYQLWEYEIVPVQSTRRDIWINGKIIHHLRTRYAAYMCFKALAPHYDEVAI